jgi:hypothetical protein
MHCHRAAGKGLMASSRIPQKPVARRATDAILGDADLKAERKQADICRTAQQSIFLHRSGAVTSPYQ